MCISIKLIAWSRDAAAGCRLVWNLHHVVTFPVFSTNFWLLTEYYSSCSGTRLQVSMSDKLQKAFVLHKVVFFLRFPVIYDVITVIFIHFQLCRWPGACRFEALRCRCVTLGHQMQSSLLQYIIILQSLYQLAILVLSLCCFFSFGFRISRFQ